MVVATDKGYVLFLEISTCLSLASGAVNIGEYSSRRSQDEYSLLFTEPGPEANNCFSIIFRGEYQELQNNGIKHKNTDAIVRVMHLCSRSFNEIMISLDVHRL